MDPGRIGIIFTDPHPGPADPDPYPVQPNLHYFLETFYILPKILKITTPHEEDKTVYSTVHRHAQMKMKVEKLRFFKHV